MLHCEEKPWKSILYNDLHFTKGKEGLILQKIILTDHWHFFSCFTHSAYDFKALEISNNVDDGRIVFQNFRVIYCSGSYPLKDGYFFIFSFGKLCISENSNSLQERKITYHEKECCASYFPLQCQKSFSTKSQKQSDFNATFANRCRIIDPLRRAQMRALVIKN